MASLEEPLIFQHCPLPDARTHVRLLKVLSVVKARAIPVHCELTVFPVTEAPPYRAISYTWGDLAPLALILVNGQRMEVRLNCEYALGQVSQHTGDETGDFLIWIDSICINQFDNHEKGAQVAMMGEIFKTATQVLACVGTHDNDSAFLYEFLRGQEAKFRPSLFSDAANNYESRAEQSLMLQLAAWMWTHSRSKMIRLYKALANFLARPYFQRVWIYQELFLGKDISVYCSDEKVPISWIWVTDVVFTSPLGSSSSVGYWIYSHILPRSVRRTYVTKTRGATPLLLAGATEQPLMRFPQAAAAVAALSCQDGRDRVYGILSIIGQVESHHFQPDYTKDRFDLAIEVLQKTREAEFDFNRIASYVQTVGVNLNLKETPTQKLDAAMELRRSPTNLQVMVSNVEGTRDEMVGTKFVGCRILLQQEEWRFEHRDKWFPRHRPTFVPAKMQKWIQGDKIRKSSAVINLPPEAQNGDWLLRPPSVLWMDLSYPRWSVALLARHYDAEKFEIVGKALISRWSSKWNNAFNEEASTFEVYCDPEDLLVLFSLCKWDDLWCLRKLKDSESYDDYFRTRFCGNRFSSYAVYRDPGYWERIGVPSPFMLHSMELAA